MPGWSGSVGSNLYKTYGAVRSSSHGTVLTGVTTAVGGSKSPYTPICQSLEFNASGLLVCLAVDAVGGAVASNTLVDIAVGAAGSEVDIINGILISNNSRVENSVSYIFDRLQVPAGSRLSARYQVGNAGTATGTTTSILITPFLDSIDDVLSLGRVITYGADFSNTGGGLGGGVPIDPGGAANTLGSWIPLVTSTLVPVRSMTIAVGARNNQAMTTGVTLVDIGIGAAGSEIPIFSFMTTAGTTSDMVTPNAIGPLHFSIPTGSRIAARAQSSITDATDRLFDLILYCMD